ncbi:MAG: hypothetical protein V3T70_11800 [Phycisphaerae bacterium]
MGDDPDLDPLSYCWEERDLGPAQALSAGDNGSSPLFRSFNPVISPSRYFPGLALILSNTSSNSEKLPTTNRTMNFRVTVRDNRAGGGGVAFDSMSVTSTTAAGPFLVIAPNGGESWTGSGTVTWDVAGTDGAPVNASTVDIYLSTDGGTTFPHLLAGATPNDGTEAIIVPVIAGLPTSSARVMIRGTGNVFFDVSNNDFDVVEAGPLAINLPDGAPTSVLPDQTTDFNVEVVPGAENIVPGSPTLHHRYDGGSFLTTPMSPAGGDLYVATLPAGSCVDTPEFYVSAEGDGGAFLTQPPDAPIGVFTAIVGVVAVPLDDHFDSAGAWTVTGLTGTSDGRWEQGFPAGFGLRGDPTDDFDGGGQCFLTGNGAGNTDVDGGPTVLTSAVMDLSVGTATLSYAYWFYWSDGEGTDALRVEASPDGSTWTELAVHDAVALEAWQANEIILNDFITPTATTQIRFSVQDNPNNSIIEAAIDAVRIDTFSCDDGSVVCTKGDMNEDSVVDGSDIQRFIDLVVGGGASTPTELCAGDLDQDIGPNGFVDLDDLDEFVDCLLAGGCPPA